MFICSWERETGAGCGGIWTPAQGRVPDCAPQLPGRARRGPSVCLDSGWDREALLLPAGLVLLGFRGSKPKDGPAQLPTSLSAALLQVCAQEGSSFPGSRGSERAGTVLRRTYCAPCPGLPSIFWITHVVLKGDTETEGPHHPFALISSCFPGSHKSRPSSPETVPRNPHR